MYAVEFHKLVRRRRQQMVKLTRKGIAKSRRQQLSLEFTLIIRTNGLIKEYLYPIETRRL